MQESAIHVTSGLEEVGHASLIGANSSSSHWLILVIEIIRVSDYLNRVLSSLGFKSTFHQDVKEKAHCGII
jgi:hypothetical protein